MEYTCTACTAYTCCAVSTLYYTNKSLIKGFKASPVYLEESDKGGIRIAWPVSLELVTVQEVVQMLELP